MKNYVRFTPTIAPPTPTPSPPTYIPPAGECDAKCRSCAEGWACTRSRAHSSPHVAHDSSGNMIAQWEDGPKIAITFERKGDAVRYLCPGLLGPNRGGAWGTADDAMREAERHAKAAHGQLDPGDVTFGLIPPPHKHGWVGDASGASGPIYCACGATGEVVAK